MIKRVITGILTFVLACSLLCGCSTFISEDTELDNKQVIARVEAYDIGDYRTEEKLIYKLDLIEYVNTNYNTLISTVGSDAESVFKYAANTLVNIEVIINEIDALIASGEIKWGLTQDNLVKKNIYDVIDNTLITLRNEILSERGEEEIVTDNTEETVSTTYPVKPEETDDEEEVEDTEVWEPDIGRYPGQTSDPDRRSLDREAMRRFISLIKSRVADDFRVTAEDRALFDEDDEAIDKVIDTKGIEFVYGMIGDTHYMWYISGKSISRSQKITLLQDYLTNGITVGDDEVIDSYETLLRTQRSNFAADVTAFDTAISDTSVPVLYYPNDNYFYVKHILLQFSDEQSAQLAAYKNRIDVTDEDVEEYRALLAENIVCYPHKDGEDDLSRPMTVDQVMNEIRAVMLPLEASVKRADVAFDDLIYLYNTDPGAFGNNNGYIVKYKLAEGESETYMQEFVDAARYMRENLGVGQVYYEKVITDYGVHIMYFASTTSVGEVGLYDYTTPGGLETYYDVLKEPIRAARESAAYSKWQDEALSYNFDKHAEIYEDRFKNLYE